ncbi:MAG: response regulator [Deltaproteobacteria bacterium]|nr:response regulator [Deltaproteobacteria bacterium]MBW1793609.1 response regulator [Deltaproteobacteria bacterium]
MMAKILIVDDQACVRELLSEELISDGYRVATAGDAESISGHMRFSEPDLVLLDLYLDGAEGFRILRDIKGQNPDLPVIIFTAYDSYWEDPRLSQADGYVIKSIDLGELKGKIADILSRKPAPQELEVKTHFPESSMAYG